MGQIIVRSGGKPYVGKPSELQIEILKHMLSCTSEAETVSHISKEINALQPAVFRSVKSMLRNGVLSKLTLTSVKKQVSLTSKGMAIAVLAGIQHKKLEEFLSKSEGFQDELDKEEHGIIQTIIQLGHHYWPTRQDSVLKTALEYMVITDWFEKERQSLTKEDRLHLFIFLIPYILTHAKEVKDIVELIDKFGIDKRRFGELLMDRVNSSVEAVNEYRRYTKIPYLIEESKKAKVFLKNIEEMVSPRLRLDPEYDLSKKEYEIDAIKLVEKVQETKQSIESSSALNKVTENIVSNSKVSQSIAAEESLPKKMKKKPT